MLTAAVLAPSIFALPAAAQQSEPAVAPAPVASVGAQVPVQTVVPSPTPVDARFATPLIAPSTTERTADVGAISTAAPAVASATTASATTSTTVSSETTAPAAVAPHIAASRAGVAPVAAKRVNAAEAAAAADQHMGAGENVALMVVGGAAFVTGLIVGGGGGTAIAIGGAAIGLWGLYNYVK